MIEEIFKDIEGYFGLYQISNYGNVKSIKSVKNKILKPQKISGYLMVCLSKQGKVKLHLVHRLVAQTFIDNPNNLPEVNHRDEDKMNNCVTNLEWCTPKYNANYGTRNKRLTENNTNNKKTSKQVICLETGKIYPSTMEIERELGFAQSNISFACTGRYKTAYGYTWKFVE